MRLQPQRNCWRIERADAMAVLVDAEAYFSALYEALCAAERQVVICGWDFDSRLVLQRDVPAGSGEPLGRLLSSLTESRPDLEVYILAWDFASIYLLEREAMPRLKFALQTPARVHFELDANHPLGGSMHEKLVVVDDAIAFCGGLDLCDVRWDTRAHDPVDPRRLDLRGHLHHPHHDVQVAVTGPAAAVLGEHVRERWQRATGTRLEAPRRDGTSIVCPPPQFTDVDVAIVRTVPDADDDRMIREVEQLWLDAIASAERSIYIENPYLTSTAVAEALCRRLREPDGPDIVLVTADDGDGWIERHTMTVLRDRTLRSIRAADRFQRFGMYTPVVPHPNGSPCHVNLHGKVCIVDDAFVRIGSANLTNRSMGLDRECDLALVADGRPEIGRAALALRHDLLTEHLDVDLDVLVDAIDRHGLRGAVERLRGRERTLVPYEPHTSRWVDAVVPGPEVIDPDRPVDPGQIGRLLVQRPIQTPRSPRAPRSWTFVALGWWSLLLVAAATAGLLGWIDYADLGVWMAEFAGHGWLAGIVAVVAFVVGGLLLVPVTLMLVNAGLVFGPVYGTIFGLTGALVGAAVYYAIGRRLGRHVLDRLAGPRLRGLTRTVAERGLLAVAAIRLVPIAPHVVVGLLAGGSRIAFRDYMLGTIIAMAPGAVMLVLLGHSLGTWAEAPDPSTLWPVIALLTGSLALAWLLQRLVGRGAVLHDRPRGEPPPVGVR